MNEITAPSLTVGGETSGRFGGWVGRRPMTSVTFKGDWHFKNRLRRRLNFGSSLLIPPESGKLEGGLGGRGRARRCHPPSQSTNHRMITLHSKTHRSNADSLFHSSIGFLNGL
jgi:hypothetical protein